MVGGTLPIYLPSVQKLLHNINTHKTSDPNSTSGRILKELKEQTTSVGESLIN
jgi:hypothetical protein